MSSPAHLLTDLHSSGAHVDHLLLEWEASKQAGDPRRRATICLRIALTHLAKADITRARQFQQLAASAVAEMPSEDSVTLFKAVLSLANTIDGYDDGSPLLESERLVQERNWPAAIVELGAVIEKLALDEGQSRRLALAHEAYGYAWFQIGDQTQARRSFETAEQIAMTCGTEHFELGNARVYRQALARLKSVAEVN